MTYKGRWPGTWITFCDVCGFRFPSDKLKDRWDGLKVCKNDWELRHPQDFIRVREEVVVPPWTRPHETEYIFVPINWDIWPVEQLATEDSTQLSFSSFIPSGILPYYDAAVNAFAVNASPKFTWTGTTSAESISISDQISIEITKYFSDSVSSTEAATSGNTGSISDSVTLSDSPSAAIGKSLSEIVSSTDAASQGQIASLSDLATVTDTLTSSASQNISDSVTMAELPSSQIYNPTQLNGRVLNGASLNAN